MQDIFKESPITAQERELGSFENIYKETSRFVYNVALRIVNNRQDAEEIMQDVFLNVYNNLKNFHFHSSVKTWIYRITVNSAINYVKKMSREKSRIRQYGVNMVQSGETTGGRDIEKANQREDEEKVISSLLEILDADQRACIVLRNIEGLSYREIADTLKININTVRTRLRRAREKLMNHRKEVIKNGL